MGANAEDRISVIRAELDSGLQREGNGFIRRVAERAKLTPNYVSNFKGGRVQLSDSAISRLEAALELERKGLGYPQQLLVDHRTAHGIPPVKNPYTHLNPIDITMEGLRNLLVMASDPKVPQEEKATLIRTSLQYILNHVLPKEPDQKQNPTDNT
ncbi:MAG: hypothetical protein AMXMBFR84_26480 [Candidatus Hydrogenedentota bacterium]